MDAASSDAGTHPDAYAEHEPADLAAGRSDADGHAGGNGLAGRLAERIPGGERFPGTALKALRPRLLVPTGLIPMLPLDLADMMGS